MKRRILLGLAAIVAVIVIAAAVAPYFVGRVAEGNFKAQIARINSRHTGVIVHVDSYQRGFYSSEAKLSLTPQAEMAPRAMQLWSILLGSQGKPQFDLRINHGPIAFAAFGDGHVSFMPVLYTAEFQGEKLPPMSLVGIFKPDLYVRQSFAGSIDSMLNVPAGRYSMGVLGATWQGAHMETELNGAQDRMHYAGSIEPIDYQAQNPSSGENYSGRIKGFGFSGDKQLSKYDFWTGTSRFTFKGAEFKVNGQQVTQLAGGQGHGEIRETADGKWLGGSSESVQNGGTIRGWRFAGLTFDESASHIDAALLRRFLDRLNAAARSAGTSPDTDAIKQALPVLGRALAPAQATAHLALAAPDGRFEVRARVSFDAAAPAATATQAFSLLDRINARATLDFDRKLVDGFSTRVLGGAEAARTVDQVLDQWQQQGYLKTGPDGREHSLLTYHAGEFAINGQVIISGSDDPQPGSPH